MTDRYYDIRELLEEKAGFYNRPEFIKSDPVSIPHLFSKKEDIEISGFLAATLSWGQRKVIISNALRLMAMMDWAPHDFIIHASSAEIRRMSGFTHRTFNGTDCMEFVRALRHIYREAGGLEATFGESNAKTMLERIMNFRRKFLAPIVSDHAGKHVANPSAGSSAKRINMFLRWMVRHDDRGVDLGIWKSIDPADLICPLDVHSGNVARKLGILQRNQNDWKAAEQLTGQLRAFDRRDPVRFDFALFGLGIFEHF